VGGAWPAGTELAAAGRRRSGNVASGLATVALANGGQGRRAGAGWAGSAQCSFLSYLLFFLVLCSMKNCDVYELNMCVEIDCCGN
jgi:hypothetical protein